jgi:hypothetical protein
MSSILFEAVEAPSWGPGGRGGIRTRDPGLVGTLLYPAELLGPAIF